MIQWIFQGPALESLEVCKDISPQIWPYIANYFQSGLFSDPESPMKYFFLSIHSCFFVFANSIDSPLIPRIVWWWNPHEVRLDQFNHGSISVFTMIPHYVTMRSPSLPHAWRIIPLSMGNTLLRKSPFHAFNTWFSHLWLGTNLSC